MASLAGLGIYEIGSIAVPIVADTIYRFRHRNDQSIQSNDSGTEQNGYGIIRSEGQLENDPTREPVINWDNVPDRFKNNTTTQQQEEIDDGASQDYDFLNVVDNMDANSQQAFEDEFEDFLNNYVPAQDTQQVDQQTSEREKIVINEDDEEEKQEGLPRIPEEDQENSLDNIEPPPTNPVVPINQVDYNPEQDQSLLDRFTDALQNHIGNVIFPTISQQDYESAEQLNDFQDQVDREREERQRQSQDPGNDGGNGGSGGGNDSSGIIDKVINGAVGTIGNVISGTKKKEEQKQEQKEQKEEKKLEPGLQDDTRKQKRGRDRFDEHQILSSTLQQKPLIHKTQKFGLNVRSLK